MSTFTIAEAIAIQTKQLTRWKPFLKAEIYNQLCALVVDKNRKYFTSPNPRPDDVFRGHDIDHAILRLKGE